MKWFRPGNKGTDFLSAAPQRPDDAGSTDLRNVGKLLPVYTALQPRRQPSSNLSPFRLGGVVGWTRPLPRLDVATKRQILTPVKLNTILPTHRYFTE
jgi:hypothetical protein